MDKFEEIRKLKELMDEGIITQEEFEAKKKEFLEAPIVAAPTYNSGTQSQGAAASGAGNTAAAGDTKISAKATGILSYISLVFWLVAYLIGDREGAKFHLNQSLVINLGMLLCAIPVIGWIWAIFMCVVWVMGLVYAVKEEEKELPLLGSIKLLN